MAEDRLYEVLEKVTNKFVADEMIKHIESAWPDVVENKALRDECADYIGDAPKDKQFKRASSLVKLSGAAHSEKSQDDGGFQKFLDENFAGVPLDEGTISELRKSYSDMFNINAAEKTVDDDYEHQYLYKDLSVVIHDTIPNIERMADQYDKAQALLTQQAEPDKMPTWSIINDQNGYQYAAMIFRNEYVPQSPDAESAKVEVDRIARVNGTGNGLANLGGGLHGCLNAMLQKSAMAGTAMEVLGEIHPQFDKVDKETYREQIKDYPSIALVGLLRTQLNGGTIISPKQLSDIINRPENIKLGMNLDAAANPSTVLMDSQEDRRVDVANKESVKQFVRKDIEAQKLSQMMTRLTVNIK